MIATARTGGSVREPVPAGPPMPDSTALPESEKVVVPDAGENGAGI